MQGVLHIYSVTAKAATDPKNWIRDPAGSDPDPDPLTHDAFFQWPKRPQNVSFLACFFCNFLNKRNFLRNNFETGFKQKKLSKIKEQILNAQNVVQNLAVHSSLTDPDLAFWIRVVSRSGSGSGSAGSVAALEQTRRA